MADATEAVKENRVWWLVLALLSITTALLVLNYIDKAIWEIVVLTLFATYVTGIAVNVVAQGTNTLLVKKGEAAKTNAEAEKVLADAHALSVTTK